MPSLPGVGYDEEISRIQASLEALREREPAGAAWKTVQAARHKDRPQTLDYIEHGFPDFVEMHGDRLRGDDPAIVGGMATLAGGTVMVIGHQKGHDLPQRQRRNFGMPKPDGYRKVQRLVRLAQKFNMPVVTFVDTPGAFPGADAEEGGQAGAIAATLRAFAELTVPTIAVVIGEGGSGGALALALCDRVLMLENAIYSVITPEGCAAILWRDASEAPQAAEALDLTALDLFRLGVVDSVVPEPRRGAHRHHRATAKVVMRQVGAMLSELQELPPSQRRRERRLKYLAMGSFSPLPDVA